MFLPTAPKDEAASLPSLDYKENKNEVELMTRSVIVNRAPVMVAWAAVVAERLGFMREEALSIGTVALVVYIIILIRSSHSVGLH
jgi:hypothetical protein